MPKLLIMIFDFDHCLQNIALMTTNKKLVIMMFLILSMTDYHDLM